MACFYCCKFNIDFRILFSIFYYFIGITSLFWQTTIIERQLSRMLIGFSLIEKLHLHQTIFKNISRLDSELQTQGNQKYRILISSILSAGSTAHIHIHQSLRDRQEINEGPSLHQHVSHHLNCCGSKNKLEKN